MPIEQAEAVIAAPESPTWWLTADSANLPTHRDLPSKDKSVPIDDYEFHQRPILVDSARSFLARRFPDRKFRVSGDNFIYFRRDDRPKNGAVAPDFYVMERDSALDPGPLGSIVLWQEKRPPILVLEIISETPGGEWSRVEGKGKFWIYERALEAGWYVIWDWRRNRLEVWRRNPSTGQFEATEPNAAGRYPVTDLGFEFGVWLARPGFLPTPLELRDWNILRLWNSDTGEMIPVPVEERDRVTRERDDVARERDDVAQRLQAAEERAAALAAEREALLKQLASLGISPGSLEHSPSKDR